MPCSFFGRRKRVKQPFVACFDSSLSQQLGRVGRLLWEGAWIFPGKGEEKWALKTPVGTLIVSCLFDSRTKRAPNCWVGLFVGGLVALTHRVSE